MNTNERYLHRLAADIDRRGMVAAEPAIAALADRARRAGASPVLVSVLTDPFAPEIARMRAFGMIAGQVARGEAELEGDVPILVTV